MRYAPTIAFAAALCLLTACSDASPTAPGDLRADDSGFPMGTGNKTNETPAGESGILIGSGNITKQASGHPIGTGNRGGITPEDSTTTNLNADGTTDSGHPLGSGNDAGGSEDSGHPIGTGN